MIKTGLNIVLLIGFCIVAKAQTPPDTAWYQLRFQQTVVTQYHPGFSAAYSGTNSLHQHEEAQTSLTTTFYTGLKIARNTFVYFNPEIAGGAGLSRATGVAGFPNGETFRVGNPKPQIYVARLFVEKYIPLTREKEYRDEEYNALTAYIPKKYLRLVGGRFAISDFFDNNSFSHDPRTQFLNWSLMGNGAFDYSANTRGYTWGAVAEVKLDKISLRYAATMVPRTANASNMDPDLKNALAQQAEIDYRWGSKRKGVIRLLAFMNHADMGVYKNAVAIASQTTDTPDVTLTRQKGNRKYGFGINAEKEITDYAGVFARASYNDGRTETWMFTEIDNSFSAGVSLQGKKWKREYDLAGLAFVSNGISSDHINYLKAGGVGFMVGDGRLNYSREHIIELFYKLAIHEDHFFITPDYQFVINPAYNKDRGPVNIFALRVHTKF